MEGSRRVGFTEVVNRHMRGIDKCVVGWLSIVRESVPDTQARTMEVRFAPLLSGNILLKVQPVHSTVSLCKTWVFPDCSCDDTMKHVAQ